MSIGARSSHGMKPNFTHNIAIMVVYLTENCKPEQGEEREQRFRALG